jgi:adenine phosphoribosyltransferase
MDHLRTKIRHIPDFPKPGILFYDITTLLNDAEGFSDMIGALAAPYHGQTIDHVVGIESRGFILGAAVANQLRTGFVPIRKPGKLPSKTHREDYALEYGSDGLEIHQDAVASGQRVLIVDDVLATGGTAKAAAALVRRIGADVVGVAFLIELKALAGRARLTGENVYSVLQY